MHISKTDIAIGTAGLLAGAAVTFAFSRTKLSPAFMAVGLAPPSLAAAIVAVKATCRKASPEIVLPAADECCPKVGEAPGEAAVRILTLFRGVRGVNSKFLEDGIGNPPSSLPEQVIGKPAAIYARLSGIAEFDNDVDDTISAATVEKIEAGTAPFEALTESRVEFILKPLHEMGIDAFDPSNPEIFERDPQLCQLGIKVLAQPRNLAPRLVLYAHNHELEQPVVYQMLHCAEEGRVHLEVARYSDEQLAAWITETFEPWVANRKRG